MFFHTLPVPDLHRRSQPLLDMFDTGANRLPGQRQECENTWNNATEQGNYLESPVVATLLNSEANMGTKWPAWSDIRCPFWSGHYHQKPSKTNATQTSCTCTSNNWKSNHSCKIEKSMTPEHCKMLQWDYEALLDKDGRQLSSTNSTSLLSSPLSDSVLLPSRSTSEDETHCSKFPPKRLDTFRNSIMCHDQSRTRLNFQRLILL